MEVDFTNNRIKKDCSSIEAMRKKFGDRRAEVLNTRLKQLLAATNLEDLRNAPGDWHELSQNRRGQISASIGHVYRLIIVPSEDPPPTKPDGGLDWSNITAVTVVETVDYH